MENKKKTISDYEKRLMEDRAMLDELVEENYMSGSEMVKNQLKHFRQELDYMENQLHFIKYEMREQKVTEATVKNNIEEKVVQKDNVQVNNEAVSQIVSEKNDKVDYVFTWSKQSENIMLDWKPEASLYMYLITKFKYLSAKENVDENKIREQADANNGVVETWDDKMSRLGQESLLEMYNATMTTLGIPADAPITAEVKVIPTVLESVSRTAGIYIIKSATDTISTDGTYTTQFKLFRIRGLNEADAVSAKEIASNQTDETKEETKTVYTDLYTREEVPVSQTTNKTYNRKVQPSAVSQLSNKVQLVKASDMQNKVLKVVP